PPKPPSPSGYALGTFTVATTHNNSQDPRGDSLFSTFVPTDPQVYVEPVAGTVGVADVRITGVGFEGPVTLSLYPHGQPGSGVSLGTASINANSEIEPAFEVVVPAGAVSGPSTIQATDTSGLTAYAAFLVWTGGVAVTPESATVGSQVALDATGFSPNTSFTILLDGEPVANASTNAGGDLQAAFAVPELAGGNHIVSVDGVETILEVVRDFTVEEDTSTIFEQAYLVRGSGLIPTVGLMVGFDGRAYTSDATAGPEGVVRGVDPRVDILEGSLGGLVWASAAPSGRTVRPTGLGTLAVRFRVPPKPLSPGGYALDLLTVASTTSNAQDPRGDSLFGTTVQTAPQVSVTPDAGTVGVDSVTVTGVGFSGEVALSLHPEANLSSGVLLGSASTNAQSAIDPAFEGVIPAQAIEGESVVQARDSAGRLAYAPLLVWRAGLTLGKTTAVVGESVPLTGFGFGTNTTLDVLFDGTVAGRVPVDGSGDMAGTFVVPPRSQGDYTVSVAGVRRTFAVLPHFVVTEEGADPFGNPTLMRISGSGIPGGDLLISLNGIAYTQDATVQAGAGLVDEDPRVTITDGVLGGLVFASTVTFGRTFRALADGSIALDFAPPMLPPPPPGPAGYELALVESAHAFFPGDDPRGAVVFSTAVLVAPSPVLAVRNQWVFDPGPDGNRDSEANSGERVQLRIRIKNESNVDAQNVRVTVTTDDPSIAVVNGEIEHATWPAGEARNSDGLVLDISPAATTHEAMLSVHITADNGGPWEFQVPIPIVRPAVVFSLRNSWVFDPTPTGDNDGEANRGERIRPRIRLRNDGDGEALNVRVTLLVDDPTVTAVNAEVAHATWPAGQARNNDGLVLQIAENAAPHDIPVVVRVVSDNGRTQEFPITISVIGPEIEFSLRNSWVFDPTPGGDKDGVADAGERVQPKVRLRNDGPLDGADVQVSLTTDDPDVTVVSGHVTHETWPAGVARNNDGLVLDISADATSHDALLTVTVASNTGGPWTFPLVMSIAAPAVQFSLRNSWVFEPTAATRNGKADAGERVQPRIRLRNDGPDEAQNVTVTLTTDDEDVRTVSSQVTHATWPGGGARNNEGFVFDIAEDATSHAAVFTVNVTADNGGPWQFQVTIPVAAPAVRFSQRKAWIFEPAAATRNGVADAGERVLPRVRLGHDGAEDAQNVVVTLTTEDPDITIVTGQVTHETWPAGAARNNEGMAVDIVDGATSHGALLTLTITADNGGPWVFAFAIPIAGTFSVRNAWVFDPAPGGDKNGVADAGERVLPRVRLRTDASADAQNVTVTLTTDDEDVTVVTGRVTHDTWPAGVARNNEGLVLDIAENATTHDASLTVTVTADGGGPWQFQISIPVAGGPTVSFVQRSSWIQDKVTGDGDGVAAPGEQVEVRARLLHDGVTDAANVVVTLSTVDEDVTVSSATVTHATWTAGHARNNVGLIVDLGEGVGPSVDFVLDVTADNGGPWTFSFTIDVALPAAPAALAMPEDIDLDGVVGIRDILAVATVYGRRASALPPADLNGDRLLDMADMMLIEAARVDVGVGAPSGHVSPAGLVERWLREARRADDGTTPFRRGIAALQGVLASLRPAVTAIYANYPNPFNPETWIPFDLSKAAEATVTIYDVMGSPVRRIELGSLDAGAYRARRSAAYWDGRNDHGEPVTSGVYVYELRAGTHRGMRRMVVRK
ncbi:hypothetical protein CMK11_20970, partial [Candidatus Poribacteria bacterium]|nr:hypothetical protein [Candidatus Poribacteria bacterium]